MKIDFFIVFVLVFQISVADKGNNFFNSANKPKTELVHRKLNYPENKFFLPNWHPYFNNRGGSKKSYSVLDYFEIILELFNKCLGILFGAKRDNVGCISAIKVDK